MATSTEAATRTVIGRLRWLDVVGGSGRPCSIACRTVAVAAGSDRRARRLGLRHRRARPLRRSPPDERGHLGPEPVDLVGHLFQRPVDVAHPVAAQRHRESDLAHVLRRHAVVGQLGRRRARATAAQAARPGRRRTPPGRTPPGRSRRRSPDTAELWSPDDRATAHRQARAPDARADRRADDHRRRGRFRPTRGARPAARGCRGWRRPSRPPGGLART